MRKAAEIARESQQIGSVTTKRNQYAQSEPERSSHHKIVLFQSKVAFVYTYEYRREIRQKIIHLKNEILYLFCTNSIIK